jgi:hypothetical protein
VTAEVLIVGDEVQAKQHWGVSAAQPLNTHEESKKGMRNPLYRNEQLLKK